LIFSNKDVSSLSHQHFLARRPQARKERDNLFLKLYRCHRASGPMLADGSGDAVSGSIVQPATGLKPLSVGVSVPVTPKQQKKQQQQQQQQQSQQQQGQQQVQTESQPDVSGAPSKKRRAAVENAMTLEESIAYARENNPFLNAFFVDSEVDLVPPAIADGCARTLGKTDYDPEQHGIFTVKAEHARQLFADEVSLSTVPEPVCCCKQRNRNFFIDLFLWLEIEADGNVFESSNSDALSAAGTGG
jgi:hypothetical protein